MALVAKGKREGGGRSSIFSLLQSQDSWEIIMRARVGGRRVGGRRVGGRRVTILKPGSRSQQQQQESGREDSFQGV